MDEFMPEIDLENRMRRYGQAKRPKEEPLPNKSEFTLSEPEGSLSRGAVSSQKAPNDLFGAFFAQDLSPDDHVETRLSPPGIV